MAAELSAADVAALVAKVGEAREGDLSLYGLLCLVEELDTALRELDLAQRRRDHGSGALTATMEALLEAEATFTRAPVEAKRLLADDLRRALRAGGPGVTERERRRALSFIEGQLRAAAKDESAAGEARRRSLQEVRGELEACAPVREADEALSIERRLSALQGEYAGVAQVYEAWQAGKTKFKSSDQLQTTKRRYDTLRRQVAEMRQSLEAALQKRRVLSRPAAAWSPPAADPGGSNEADAAGEWTRWSRRAPKPAAGAAASAAAAAAGAAATAGARKPARSAPEEAAEAGPARMAPKPKNDASRKAAQREAKLRGRQILQELGAELRGGAAEEAAMYAPRSAAPRSAAPRSAVPLARAPMGGSAWQAGVAAHIAEAWPEEWPEEVEEPEPPEAQAEEAQAEEAEAEAVLPPGWEAVWSDAHGAHYYWHTETDEVQWDPPEPVAAPAPPAAAPPARSGGPRGGGGGGGGGARGPASRGGGGGRGGEAAGASARRPDAAAAPPEDDEPKLSYLCVCQAVAVELGQTAAEVEALGVPSVEDWRANFSPEEWARIRDRAQRIEAEKRARALQEEKERAARNLAKVSKAVVEGQSRKAQGGAPRPAAPGGAKAPPAARGRAAGAAKAPKAPPGGGQKAGKALPTSNRFGNFGALADSDDD